MSLTIDCKVNSEARNFNLSTCIFSVLMTSSNVSGRTSVHPSVGQIKYFPIKTTSWQHCCTQYRTQYRFSNPIFEIRVMVKVILSERSKWITFQKLLLPFWWNGFRCLLSTWTALLRVRARFSNFLFQLEFTWLWSCQNPISKNLCSFGIFDENSRFLYLVILRPWLSFCQWDVQFSVKVRATWLRV